MKKGGKLSCYSSHSACFQKRDVLSYVFSQSKIQSFPPGTVLLAGTESTGSRTVPETEYEAVRIVVRTVYGGDVTMLIKCQVCNHENQLGSIFCRNCGVKLDLNKMSPDQFKEKKPVDKGAVTRKVVGVVLLLIVLGLLGAIFIPAGYPSIPEPSEEAKKSGPDKLDTLERMIEIGARGQKSSFTAEELTAILNASIAGGSSSGESSYSIEKVFVEEAPGGGFHLTLNTKLAGTLDVVFSMTGEPEIVDGVPVFTVREAKAGHLPMFGSFFQKLVSDKFKPVVSKAVKSVAGNAAALSSEGGTLTVTLKDSREEKKE